MDMALICNLPFPSHDIRKDSKIARRQRHHLLPTNSPPLLPLPTKTSSHHLLHPIRSLSLHLLHLIRSPSLHHLLHIKTSILTNLLLLRLIKTRNLSFKRIKLASQSKGELTHIQNLKKGTRLRPVPLFHFLRHLHVEGKSNTSPFTSANRGLHMVALMSVARRREIRLNLWQSRGKTSRTSLPPNAKKRYFGLSVRKISTRFNKRSRRHAAKTRWQHETGMRIHIQGGDTLRLFKEVDKVTLRLTKEVDMVTLRLIVVRTSSFSTATRRWNPDGKQTVFYHIVVTNGRLLRDRTSFCFNAKRTFFLDCGRIPRSGLTTIGTTSSSAAKRMFYPGVKRRSNPDAVPGLGRERSGRFGSVSVASPIPFIRAVS